MSGTNRDAMKLRSDAVAIWQAGVDAVGGYNCVRNALSALKPDKPDRIIGVGKASVEMCLGALSWFDDTVPVLAVTKKGHAASGGQADLPEDMSVMEAGHPVPDGDSVRGGEALLEAVRAMGSDETLLLLVSGGASALAEVPRDGFSLGDIQAENRRMLAEGLDIHAINTRRKQFSQIKGGGLLDAFGGRKCLVLLMSDVVGDSISAIGSGIGLHRDDPRFESHVIASNAVARTASASKAGELGWPVVMQGEELHGDVMEVAARVGSLIRSASGGCVILGGEPTVVLPANPGRGGRNQALALALSRELSGCKGLCVLVAGTDGTDGPTDAAGGFADGEVWFGNGGGEKALERADAGNWLEAAGALYVTGPTGTNVMDLLVAIKLD
ncbi:MAG: DUF4147 domain-containing protein [Rhizobiaceae bacterium]